MSEYSMRDLFRQETNTQVESLRQSIAVLKDQPTTTSELESAIRALQTIEGVARLVDLDAPARLAEAMQSCFVAAQNQQAALTSAKLDQLLYGCTLLIESTQIEDAELTQWLFKHTEEFVRVQSMISDLQLFSEMPQPTPSRVKPQPAPTVKPQPAPTAIGPPPEVAPHNDATSPPAPQIELKTPVKAPSAVQNIVLNDPSLMDLFRQEVEAQATQLNNGLIALETNPDSAQELEALMRAAHSIKGAARIVGLDVAVNLAHVMEDRFVAAQHHDNTLNAKQIDALFRGVDLLQSLSQIPASKLSHWLDQHRSEFEAVQQSMSPNSDNAVRSKPEASLTIVEPQAPIKAQPPEPPQIIQPSQPSAPEPPPHDSTGVAQSPDRVVRVSADNLNRIIGLAGESMIEANWLQPFANSLMLLKSRQLELAKTLEALEQTLTGDASIETDSIEGMVHRLRLQEQECRELLGDRIGELEDYIRRTDSLSDRLYREVIRSQMRPFADGVQSFPRMVRDLARQLGKQVKLEIQGESTVVDRDILKRLEAPLTHILRNTVDHGIESPDDRAQAGKPLEGTVNLQAFHRGGMLAIVVSDDGRGIAPKQMRQQIIRRGLATADVARQMSEAELMEFLFLPGFSLSKQVTELSGRGVGLDIAKTMAQEVGGTVRALSTPGKGTSFHFQLPLTLSVVRTLLVEVAGEPYAFPLSRIDQIVSVDRSTIAVAENRPYFTLNDKNIGLIALDQVLERPPSPSTSQRLWVVIISYQSATYGLIVDRCLGERELVVRPLDPRLGKVQDISATALMGDGSLVLILDVSDLVRSTNTLLDAGRLTKPRETDPTSTICKRVLVVDDSITVREVERKLLQNRGYEVDVAVDGMEGWNAVRNNSYDLVISDIDMPRMNGIELIKQIKSHPRLRSMPVIVVSYRDREDDRLQGLEAGADYYLTKSSFHDDTLIQAVIDLIG